MGKCYAFSVVGISFIQEYADPQRFRYLISDIRCSVAWQQRRGSAFMKRAPAPTQRLERSFLLSLVQPLQTSDRLGDLKVLE